MAAHPFPNRLAQAFKQACLDELTALKPGNVHIFSDGHGMVVQDFIKSAQAASEVIAQENLMVGQRILQAVNATWNAVGCNTNLGIILLAAPIIQANLHGANTDLKTNILTEITNLTIQDAVDCYQAILRASPAGLGDVEQHDVKHPPAITLLAAMQAAQSHDLIAKQYANGYKDIFEFGLPIYNQAVQKWDRPAWATTLLYLAYFSKFIDSHIARKFGVNIAQDIQKEAKEHYESFALVENPKNYSNDLLSFDKKLKEKGINPGTSADLTVATLFINLLL